MFTDIDIGETDLLVEMHDIWPNLMDIDVKNVPERRGEVHTIVHFVIQPNTKQDIQIEYDVRFRYGPGQFDFKHFTIVDVDTKLGCIHLMAQTAQKIKPPPAEGSGLPKYKSKHPFVDIELYSCSFEKDLIATLDAKYLSGNLHWISIGFTAVNPLLMTYSRNSNDDVKPNWKLCDGPAKTLVLKRFAGNQEPLGQEPEQPTSSIDV